MAKQWATRVVLAFQSVCWCLAILLLLSRGVSNIRYSYDRDASVQSETITSNGSNATVTLFDSSARGYSLGVGLIIVAVLMIVASPAIIVARACERRRYRSVDQFPDLGLPPRYEDVVTRVPSYSSLFITEEICEDAQQLQEMTLPAIITSK